MKKIRWEVSLVPTGQYRSFDRRGWPTAYCGDKIVARLWCNDEYVPKNVRSGNHAPIRVYVAQYSHDEVTKSKYGGFRWRKLRREATTLDEAKSLVTETLRRYPGLLEPVRSLDGQFDG